MAEWQNLSSSDFRFTGTYLPDKPPSSVKCCRVCFCAAHSVWKARRARGRAGATPAQRNAIIITPLQQGSATSHVLLDQCSGERERERKTEYGPQNGRQLEALHAPALAAPPSLLLGDDDVGITDY
jgi:hypothetical protein